MRHTSSIFIDTGIEPLLAELPQPIVVEHVDTLHPQRPHVEGFIRTVFRQAHGAEVDAFYPNLIGFSTAGTPRAVLGYRDPMHAALFAEQYLPRRAHELASAQLGLAVRREQLVEVGNLALADPGHARWVIAASTTFLAAAGYRWVLFTATQTLANAFHRLGLKPLALGLADPHCLPDQGASWGGYYASRPQVYVGDIQAGLSKLQSCGWGRRPNLHALLREAQCMGVKIAEPGGECAELAMQIARG